jgi:hypothetical protein
VAYRIQHPDKATVKDVLVDLKKNKVDECQLLEYNTDHCSRENDQQKKFRLGTLT